MIAGALSVGALVADARAAELCALRPGQPTPLPRTDDPDSFGACWEAPLTSADEAAP